MSKFIRSSGIYSITSPSGKVYIGSAACFRHRWKIHKKKLEDGKHHNAPLQNAYKKYGMDELKFEILLVCQKEDLLFYEQKAIDALNPEYNICRSVRGPLGISPSQETRDKIRRKMLGKKLPKEVIDKIRIANTGKKRPADAIERTKNAHIGMKRSKEACERMSQAQRGKKISPETIEKMRIANKGRKPSPQSVAATIISNKTRIVSDATRQKMTESQKARWAKYRESSHE